MVKLSILLAVVGFAALYSVAWLVWRIVGRPAAVSLRLIPPAAHDYLVLAWKAERDGKWANALMACEQAICLDPTDPEVRACWDDFFARQSGSDECGE